MAIRYYKLFDLLNRRNMNKSDLLDIISSKTIAKLSKGANLNTDIIDKICLFLECQPSDIMEVIEVDEDFDDNGRIIKKNVTIDNEKADSIEEKIYENKPTIMSFEESDTYGFTDRQKID